tara:strand:- start:58 stop:537 length:480 start_codon:yes stop_codon:yes gene_type:complete
VLAEVVVVTMVDLVVVVEPVNPLTLDILVDLEIHHQHLHHRGMMVEMELPLTPAGVLAVEVVLVVLVTMDLVLMVVQEEQQPKHQQTGDLSLHMVVLDLTVLQEIIMQEAVELKHIQDRLDLVEVVVQAMVAHPRLLTLDLVVEETVTEEVEVVVLGSL